jgi:hypothetical protein
MGSPTKLYEAIAWELRKQLFEVGTTMAQTDDVAGLQS